MVEFEWAEDKRRANLEKHKLDFLDARSLFDGRPLFTKINLDHNESRWVSTGINEHRYYTVVWTERAEKIRIISFRRARDAEERDYRQLHG
ncbi:MAG: BrnT family toxin [Chloroflexota bacterium]|nr:BrnT family toxin [Chloroflexota bacterium]